MDATQLKAYRDKLRATENNIAIRLYCDNGIIIDEGSMFVKWDDANNVIMAIKSNEDQQNHPGVKMKIIVTDFDMVQYMIAYSTHKSVQPIAKFDNQDLRTYLNAVPEDVLHEIVAQQAAIDAQAKATLQLQEDRAKAEHRVTAQQIRERQQ